MPLKNQESHRRPAPLSDRVSAGADAEQVADAVVAIWLDIEQTRGRAMALSSRALPVADLRQILARPGDVVLMLDQFVLDQLLLPHGNPFLDCRNVDVVLGERLVDLLQLGAIARILRPPERQRNLSAFADQGLHLRSAAR
jgi:hypothetical protein